MLKLESSRYFLHLMEIKQLGKSWWKQHCFSIPRCFFGTVEWNNLAQHSPPSAQLPAHVLAGLWCLLLSETCKVPVPDVQVSLAWPAQHCTHSRLWILCALCHSQVQHRRRSSHPTPPRAVANQLEIWKWPVSHRLICSIGALFPADSPPCSSGFPVPLWSKFSLTG